MAMNIKPLADRIVVRPLFRMPCPSMGELLRAAAVAPLPVPTSDRERRACLPDARELPLEDGGISSCTSRLGDVSSRLGCGDRR